MYSGGALAANLLRSGASGGGTDVLIAVQDFATGTTLSTPISYPCAELGSLTPKALLLTGSHHAVANGSSERSDSIIAIGAIAGTDQRTVSEEHNDNSGSSSPGDSGSSIALEMRNLTGTVDFLELSATLESGGMSGTYTRSNENRRPCYMAFAGDDVTAKVATINLGTGTAAISVSCGFEPDAIIFFGQNRTSNSRNNDAKMTYGLAINGTQRCVLNSEYSGLGSGGNPLQAILTDACAGLIDSTGALTYKAVAGGFNSDGFEVTPSANAGSVFIHYLALKFTGGNVALLDINTPTTTGDHAITGVGFEPQAMFAMLTNLQATDPTFPITKSDDMAGLAFCNAAGSTYWSHATRNRVVDPTDTGCYTGNNSMIQPSATNTKAGLATLVSFDSDGVTQNWSAAQGSARKGFVLFIE